MICVIVVVVLVDGCWELSVGFWLVDWFRVVAHVVKVAGG